MQAMALFGMRSLKPRLFFEETQLAQESDYYINQCLYSSYYICSEMASIRKQEWAVTGAYTNARGRYCSLSSRGIFFEYLL